MINKLFLSFSLFIVSGIQAQTAFEKEASKAVRLIERNLTVSDDKNTASLFEFFIYVVNLDSCAKIITIDVFRMDSLSHLSAIKDIASKIKENWVPVKSSFTKILIPVLITNSGIENDEAIHDKSVRETATFFHNLFGKSISSNVYVARMAIVSWYSNPKIKQ